MINLLTKKYISCYEFLVILFDIFNLKSIILLEKYETNHKQRDSFTSFSEFNLL
jgi:hypothetical protein